ncbi:MAG TPA: globin family protein [Burkholderiaceae bacterium]|jgi:hemoglobin-like flavoprotein|nr:globin family protein [Burkholderiaceae bacterium]
MNAQQINLVQESLKKIIPNAEVVANLFYKKLFELDPALKPLFKSDMQEQGRKLMQMIATAVNALNNLDALLPVAQALGARHGAYGVKDKDYDTVGEALLWTLATGLGKEFTPPVREAWTQTYMLLAGVMKDSAKSSA